MRFAWVPALVLGAMLVAECVPQYPVGGTYEPDGALVCNSPANATGVSGCFLGDNGCSIACKDSFGDCDLNPLNGCETSLLDSPNCGACGVTTCGAGQPEMLFASGQIQNGIAVDTNNVYWMTDGTLNAAPKGGGTPVALANEPAIATDVGLLVDDQYVYWPYVVGPLKLLAPPPVATEVHRVPLTGGAVEVAATFGTPIVSNVVVYGGIVYAVVKNGDPHFQQGLGLVDSNGKSLLSLCDDCDGDAQLRLFGSVLYVAWGAESLNSQYATTNESIVFEEQVASVRFDGTEPSVAYDNPDTHVSHPLLATNATSAFFIHQDTFTWCMSGFNDVTHQQQNVFLDTFTWGSASGPQIPLAAIGVRMRDLIATDTALYAAAGFGAEEALSVVLRIDSSGATTSHVRLPSSTSTTRLAADESYIYYATTVTGASGSVYRVGL